MSADLVRTALGKRRADLAINGGFIINVYTEEAYRADVAVTGNRIAAVDESLPEGLRTLNVEGMYLVPGFIDSHTHVEMSFLTLREFGKTALKHGTTCVIEELHEIANVLGLRGVKLLLEEAEALPVRYYFQIPSCVPSSHHETSGANVSIEEIKRGLKLPGVVGLGEFMDVPSILKANQKALRKIEIARRLGAVIEGHCPGLEGSELNAYASTGISSDHEAFNPMEGVEKLRAGLTLEIREGSTVKNLRDLLKPILKLNLSLDNCCLATDDILPIDLETLGYMDYVVRRAIEEGVDPVKAVKMATLNPARHFRLERSLGSLTPGKLADIVVLKNLEKVEVDSVILNGKIAYHKGDVKVPFKKFRFPSWAYNTVKLKRKIGKEELKVRLQGLSGSRALINVIRITEGQAYTVREKRWLEVNGGEVLSGGDVAKVFVIERHGKRGSVGKGFIAGLGLKKGAISSTIGHDAHNIIVAGHRVEDVYLAFRRLLKTQGGIVIVHDGKVVCDLPLPIAGLMSDKKYEHVLSRLKEMECEARKLGVSVKSPFVQLSFISLTSIPEIRLTDLGLFDVKANRFIDLIERTEP
ncbi:MAG: adenine deaminase [Candidatus Bathyarchaeia archaeon]